MLDLVTAMRPDLTQAEAREFLHEFLRGIDPRSAEAWSFFLDYGFEMGAA
jgi:hypothetical protein